MATANALEVFGASGAALDGMRNWVKANKVSSFFFSFFSVLDLTESLAVGVDSARV